MALALAGRRDTRAGTLVTFSWVMFALSWIAIGLNLSGMDPHGPVWAYVKPVYGLAQRALFAAWFETPQLVRFPGGESLQDLAARVADALRFVLTRHTDGTIVIVGHDSVNRALLLQLLDLPLAA